MNNNDRLRIVMGNRVTEFESGLSEEVKDLFSFNPPGYFHSPKYQMRVWDGKICLIKYRKTSTGLFLDLLPELQKIVPDIQLEDNRLQPKFKEDGLVSDRAAQRKCVRAMIRNSNCGGKVLMATGTGKTYLAAMYFSRLVGMGIFIVDELALMRQAQKELSQALKEDVGILGAQRTEIERITVCTIQTLHNRKRDPKLKKWFKKIDAIFIDEFHQQMNKRNVGVLAAIPAKAVFGLTATLELTKKHIRYKAANLTGPTIFQYSLQEGIADDVLTPGVCVGLNLHRAMATYWKRGDAYDKFIVSSRVRNDAIEHLVRAAVEDDKYVLVLVDRVKHVHKIMDRLADLDPEAAFGGRKVRDRLRSMKRVERGDLHVIVANKVFKKGISIKRIDVIMDCASMSSRNDAQQKYGRGVRQLAGKDGLIYIDVGDVLKGVGHNPFAKGTKRRRSALRKNGVVVKYYAWDPDKPRRSTREVYELANHELRKLLKRLG